MLMQPPSSFRVIEPEGMHRAPGYVHGLLAGNTLYIAGQVAYNEQGVIVAPDAAAGQARQVMSNIEKILKAAGADWRNVVKMTTYLVDRADSPAVSEVRLAALQGHRPPHTGLIVAALGRPEVRLEIEAIAVLTE
jgi:2-iminobutanoate/2-iminopropanoate deaminase